MRTNSERGFTLIEITAVLILIGALAAIVGPEIMKSVAKGKVKAANAQISLLKSTLNEYKLENGAYPTTEQGLAALYTRPTVPPVPDSWDGPYLEEPIGKDPWGRPYVYCCPGRHSERGFDLYSLGADGAEGGSGTNADITSWYVGQE